MKTNHIYWIIPLIILLIIIIFLLYGIFTIPLSTSAYGECRANIKEIYNRLDFISQNTNKTFANLPENETNLNLSLGKFLIEGSKAINLPEMKCIKNQILTDSWGNAFCIAWRKDLKNNSKASKLLRLDYDLIIWSKGANGINEFGQGDDIFNDNPIHSRKTNALPSDRK